MASREVTLVSEDLHVSPDEAVGDASSAVDVGAFHDDYHYLAVSDGGVVSEARLGRGKKGFLLGYQSLFLVDIEGFPLGYVEAPLNVNEKQLVEELLTRVLGESLEVELLAADSQFESQAVFDLLESLKMSHVIARRCLKGRENPTVVLTVKDRIDMEGPE